MRYVFFGFVYICMYVFWPMYFKCFMLMYYYVSRSMYEDIIFYRSMFHVFYIYVLCMDLDVFYVFYVLRIV